MVDTGKIDEKKQMQEQLKQVQSNPVKTGSEAEAPKDQTKKEDSKQGEVQTTKSSEASKEQVKEQSEQKKELKVLNQRVTSAPLQDSYKISRSHRARMAISLLREFVAKQAKTNINMVRIAQAISELINVRGSRNPPKKLKIVIKKLEDQSVLVESGLPQKKKVVREKPAVAKKKPVEKKPVEKTVAKPVKSVAPTSTEKQASKVKK